MLDWKGVNLKVTLAVHLRVTVNVKVTVNLKVTLDVNSASKLEGDSGSGSKLEGALLLVSRG